MDAPHNERELIRRIACRVMPLLILIFLIAFIDRQNVGFAKLQMLGDLGMSETVFGFGASLFFLGYVTFEIPSSFALQRYGARLWFTRIVLTWGTVTILLAFTNSALMFYVLRFLLGVAQAGFYPGAIFYITIWFPPSYRIQMFGLLSLGAAFGNMTGGVINGALLDLNGAFGFAGWQWVFLGSGIPTVILALTVWMHLPSSASTARFLSDIDRDALASAHKRVASPPIRHDRPWTVLWDFRVVGLAVIYILLITSFYAVTYWLPTVVNGFGVSGTVNGLLNAIPWGIGAVLLVLLPALLRYDRMAFSAMAAITLAGALCFAASIVLADNMVRFATLAIGGSCIAAINPFFWSVASRFFSGAQAAIAIAAINSVGNLGGFFAQNLVPWVDKHAKHMGGAMLVPAACLAILCVVCLVASASERRRHTSPRPASDAS